MFHFLRRLFGRRDNQRRQQADVDLRTLPAFGKIDESHRAIFRYWDGLRERAADPLEIWMAIDNDPEFIGDKHPQAVDDGESEASRIMGEMICRAFKVKAFDGSAGLTLQERLALWSVFCGYADDLKKSTSPWPTPPPATAATPPGSSNGTTAPSLVSG